MTIKKFTVKIDQELSKDINNLAKSKGFNLSELTSYIFKTYLKVEDDKQAFLEWMENH